MGDRFPVTQAPLWLTIVYVVLLTALPVWGIVDAALRPGERWRSIGKSKRAWIALQAVCLPTLLVGPVVSLVYLGSVRPSLRDADREASDGAR